MTEETFICDRCDEISDADFICVSASELLCYTCFDKEQKGESTQK